MRNWDTLAGSTRSRYERAGISRSSYESGVSLKAARGHAETPERPMEATKHPERYESYVSLRNDIRELKRELYGTSPRYNHNSQVKGSKRHLEIVREILEAKVDFNGSWDEFWEENPQWSRDDYAEVEHYH